MQSTLFFSSWPPFAPATFLQKSPVNLVTQLSVTLRHHAEGLPLPRREQWARQGRSQESLTSRPGIREQYRPISEGDTCYLMTRRARRTRTRYYSSVAQRCYVPTRSCCLPSSCLTGRTSLSP